MQENGNKSQLRMSDEYFKHSSAQQAGAKRLLPVITEQIDAIAKNQPQRFADNDDVFTIADLGSAGGLNSIVLLKQTVDLVRKINPKKQIAIYLEDLPTTDFSKGFVALSEVFQNEEGVYVFAIGKSFYEQLFPNNTIDLVLSSIAIHWISCSPCLHDKFFFYPSDDPSKAEENEKWVTQAKKDWSRFLECREKELKPSGVILISTPSCPDDMVSGSVLEWLKMMTIWRKAYVSLLEKHNLKHMDEVLPTIVRRKKDFTDYFSECKTSLKLQSYVDLVTPIEFGSKYEKERDLNSYMKSIAPFFRAFSQEFFRANLKEKGMDSAVVERLLEEFYGEEFPKHKEEVATIFIKEFPQSLIVIGKEGV